MNPITENNIETFALEVLKKLGWQHVHGLSIAPGAECAERDSFEQIILTQRLRKAIARLNRDIPSDAQEPAMQKVVGWMAEKYIGINGKNNKLAKLILEQDTSNKKTLTVGETWEMGGDYTLTAQSIDARSNPRLAGFVLSKDGVVLDDKVIEAASTTGNSTQGVYTYFANLGGESNVPIFVTYVDSVFSGASSDMVQLKYTWLIDNTITEVKSGDLIGIFKVDSETPLILKSDSSVSLSRNSTVTLAGNMKFRVADSPDGDVRFYPKVDYMIPEVSPTPSKRGDPNNNGVSADAGDLVLMKRASIGEIKL